MPHCIIEYSDTLTAQIAPEALTEAVFQTLCRSSLFQTDDIRARSQVFSEYRIGSDASDFIHITIRLLQGRSDVEKKQLNEQVGKAIEQLGLNSVQLSCECVDIHTTSYYRAMM